MEIKKEVLDELIKDYKKPEDLIGETGLLKQLTKALLERALGAELTQHLGYEKHDPVGYHSGNSRNGTSAKTVKGEFGEITVETPRDRNASFEPQLLKKHQTRWDGFDDKILSMYARGMTTREIQGHLQEMYGVEVSPGLISEVTDAVLEEVRTWQSRRQMRRGRYQHVDVVRRYRPSNDHHIPRLAHRSNQVARTLCYPPAQYLVTVFCDPDHVILKIERSVRAMPVFAHPSILVEPR